LTDLESFELNEWKVRAEKAEKKTDSWKRTAIELEGEASDWQTKAETTERELEEVSKALVNIQFANLDWESKSSWKKRALEAEGRIKNIVDEGMWNSPGMKEINKRISALQENLTIPRFRVEGGKLKTALSDVPSIQRTPMVYCQGDWID